MTSKLTNWSKVTFCYPSTARPIFPQWLTQGVPLTRQQVSFFTRHDLFLPAYLRVSANHHWAGHCPTSFICDQPAPVEICHSAKARSSRYRDKEVQLNW